MSTEHDQTVALLTANVVRCRRAAWDMSQAGYLQYAADWTEWSDEAQRKLTDFASEPAPWTTRLLLEVGATVVFAEAVFAFALWVAALR